MLPDAHVPVLVVCFVTWTTLMVRIMSWDSASGRVALYSTSWLNGLTAPGVSLREGEVLGGHGKDRAIALMCGQSDCFDVCTKQPAQSSLPLPAECGQTDWVRPLMRPQLLGADRKQCPWWSEGKQPRMWWIKTGPFSGAINSCCFCLVTQRRSLLVAARRVFI